MITDDDKEYLLKKLNINISNYSSDRLDVLLDEIIVFLDNSIENKMNNIKLLSNNLNSIKQDITDD